MNETTNYFDLWKHFSEEESKLKEKIWTIASWFFTLLGLVFGFIAQNLNEKDLAFKNPQAIIVVAGVGLVLSAYTFYMILENGIHLKNAFARTNYLIGKLRYVRDAWYLGKGNNEDKCKKSQDKGLPAFVIRLLILSGLFIVAFSAVVIVAFAQQFPV